MLPMQPTPPHSVSASSVDQSLQRASLHKGFVQQHTPFGTGIRCTLSVTLRVTPQLGAQPDSWMRSSLQWTQLQTISATAGRCGSGTLLFHHWFHVRQVGNQADSAEQEVTHINASSTPVALQVAPSCHVALTLSTSQPRLNNTVTVTGLRAVGESARLSQAGGQLHHWACTAHSACDGGWHKRMTVDRQAVQQYIASHPTAITHMPYHAISDTACSAVND